MTWINIGSDQSVLRLLTISDQQVKARIKSKAEGMGKRIGSCRNLCIRREIGRASCRERV